MSVDIAALIGGTSIPTFCLTKNKRFEIIVMPAEAGPKGRELALAKIAS